MVDIVEWAQSEFGFYVDRHWTDGRWVLERGPIRLADYHADLLRHCFTPDESGRLRYDVIGWCEPAKSGKTAIAGLCAEYAGLHLDGDVILASNKQNQAASLMYKSLAASVEFNPHLPNVDPRRFEVEFSNRNTVRAIPSNSRGEAGARFSLALFDELWGYMHQDAIRLWSEFKTDPTRLNSVKMAVGVAGYLESELWLDVLQIGLKGEPVPELAHITNDGEPTCWRNGRHFTFWSHECRQPWQTPAWIAGQKKSLRPAEFGRMILTEFAEGQGDFVEPEVWEALIDRSHKPLQPGDRRFPVYVGLDVATKPRGDDCALLGCYPDGDLVKLAFHKVWRGGRQRKKELRLSQTVEPYLKQIARDYWLAGVFFDPYQALQLAENLRRAGINCVEVPQTHATRGPKDTALYEMTVTGQLVLYDHPDLRSAVSFANAKELGNGLIFLTKAGRGKIDLLIALSNCANEAKTGTHRRRRIRYPADGRPGLAIVGASRPQPRDFSLCTQRPGNRWGGVAGGTRRSAGQVGAPDAEDLLSRLRDDDLSLTNS